MERRNFLKKTALGAAGITLSPYIMGNGKRILGANDKIRIGIVGFSDRTKNSLLPALLHWKDKFNYEIVGVSDIWKRRREEGVAFIEEQTGKKVFAARNNEELYEKQKPDAVIIGTADFQHALHTIEAVEAGCDAYVEKPFAEIMDDNRKALKAVNDNKKVIQIGSQRRSGLNYHAADEYIKSGKFGDITMVEMTWNVNQPGRWRRPALVKDLNESDVDWNRYLMNRPKVAWDARKYIEYRLFWPYSSGIPGQWMSHQIDTVHWFSGYNYPRSVVANGGIYMWDDGRENPDTMTAVFDYGPKDSTKGFQVLYSSRMHNSAGGVKEIYYSNGGTLNLANNTITPEGGLQERHASAMDMKPFLLEEQKISSASRAETDSNTGTDDMVLLHMHDWLKCVKDQNVKTNADVYAGYYHSIANMMVTAALKTGLKVTFDDKKQEILVGGKPFKPFNY